MRKTKYVVDNSAEINGTHLLCRITARFKDLKSVLGAPSESDGYKVSGEWRVIDGFGSVFTIYDYKQTNLYDDSLPSVREFQESQDYKTFSIGGKSDPTGLISYLKGLIPLEVESD
jgi:hypothetical protein